MSLPTHRGLGILGLAALLGVLGDALLRATPWGVNLPLWMGVAAAAAWALVPDRPNGRSPITGWPLLAVMFFALCFAWRDSSFLRFWNGVAILGALSLPALQMHGIQLRLARITDYAMGLAASGVNAVAGALFSLRSGLLGDCLNGANQASHQSQLMHHCNDYGAPKSKRKERHQEKRPRHDDSPFVSAPQAASGIGSRATTPLSQ